MTPLGRDLRQRPHDEQPLVRPRMRQGQFRVVGDDSTMGDEVEIERPRRVPVSVGAAESLVLDDAGGYTGPWDSDTVPNLIEPMDMLASRHEVLA